MNPPRPVTKIPMSTSSVVILFHWIISLCFFPYILVVKADDCLETCGDLAIPYPFGIAGKENNCGLPGFEINCNENVPFLPILSGQVQILNVSADHLLVNATQFYAVNCQGKRNVTGFAMSSEGPFRISAYNKFVAVGCKAMGLFGMAQGNGDTLWGGCLSVCSRNPILSQCNGDGCCNTPVPSNYTQFLVVASNVTLKMTNYNMSCNYAAILDESSWGLISKSGTPNFREAYMRLDWAVPNDSCASAKAKKTSYQCAPNAQCEDREWGYTCKCESGYEGNGYSNGTGCTDMDECSDPGLNECYPSSGGGRCVNTKGSYQCSCAKGRGDGTRNGTRCTSSTSFQVLPVTLGAGMTLVAVLVGGGVLFLILKRRKSWIAKKNNFRRNGGAYLQRLMSTRRKATRIFTLDEIEKATEKFSPSLILGAGGYGTVYKATLSDLTVVAIKKSKSKEVGPNDVDQFINEFVILSQINHRNVVKVIGCCLETPVPLLVYEYIANGTLSQHLYDDKYNQHRRLQWEERLRIAIEIAEALSYLHSAASIPIVHRDVKSSNILLDQDYIPKVADFGVSRLVPMDQTHITTVVQGTLGYLDPEYFQTVQLTEKSDVYSFGVVLVELLTGLDPVSYDRIKRQGNLAMYFLSAMKMEGLMGILDSRLNSKMPGNMESMERVATLAKECLSVEGEKRPTMKEVVQELLWIKRGSRPHAWLDNTVQNEEQMFSVEEEVEVYEKETSNTLQHSREMSDIYPESAPPHSILLNFLKDNLGR